jgi:serine/threonine protein kinase
MPISTIVAGAVVDTRYRLTSALAKGGQGTVWQAQDLRLGKDVALKFLRFETESVRAFFREEVRLAASVAGHPNICAILDIGAITHDDEPWEYIAYELMRDGDASLLVDTDDVPTKVQVCMDICNGLRFMHSQGFAHRDIKPKNILRSPGSRFKLADFGLAKDLRVSTRTLTARGEVGTWWYRAPEDLRKVPGYDKLRADIYQMGVTMYEMFAKRRPFDVDGARSMDLDECREALLRNISAHNLLGAGALRISHQLWQLLSDMLEADPTRRPQDMREVCARVEAEHAKIVSGYDPDNSPERKTIWEVRRAITCKVADLVTTLLSDPRSPLKPEFDEDPNWYVFGLVRPILGSPTKRVPGNLFHSVFLSWMHNSDIRATMDWNRNPTILSHTLPMDGCCSGLVVRSYLEYDTWKKERCLEDGFVQLKKGANNTIRYMLLRGVREARKTPPSPGARLIRDHYAVGRKDVLGNAIPFCMMDANGQRHSLSDTVEVEIVVPVYAPGRRGATRTADDILGVLNFEWVHPLTDARATAIGEYLATSIHEEYLFPISEFLSDIVGLVAPAYDPAVHGASPQRTDAERPDVD